MVPFCTIVKLVNSEATVHTCEEVTGNVLSVGRTVFRTDREHSQLKKVIDIL